VTTISGLQSAGKSSMALSIMNNLGNKKIPTAQFSMEMPNMSIMHKLLAFGSRLPVNTVIQKVEHLNEEELIAYNEAMRMLRMKSIYLNDKPGVPLSYIKDQIMLLQDTLKTQYMVVVLDLFGKIKDLQGSDNFARDYEKELNIVQSMVRETGIHMILVAQINKAVAVRKWSRPGMGDLKNAGAFAEISDLMLGVHRPNYDAETAMKAKMGYKRSEIDNQYIEESPDKDLAEVIIQKNRMGENNIIVNFKFDPNTTRFIPFDDEDQKILNAQKFLEEE
jgi:replicative DNA helicase